MLRERPAQQSAESGTDRQYPELNANAEEASCTSDTTITG